MLYFMIGICLVHKICAQDLSGLSAACISTPQLLGSTTIACQQRNNTELWQKIIDCHAPISEEFMRMSSEARCPKNAPIANPMDKSFSIQEVFFNICSLTEGAPQDRLEGFACLINGTKVPYKISHFDEVNVVQLLFGETVPCDIGICIKTLFNFN